MGRKKHTAPRARRRPSLEAVAQALGAEIEMYRESYREPDGIVRDRDALHTITHLEEARRIVAATERAIRASAPGHGVVSRPQAHCRCVVDKTRGTLRELCRWHRKHLARMYAGAR